MLSHCDDFKEEMHPEGVPKNGQIAFMGSTNKPLGVTLGGHSGRGSKKKTAHMSSSDAARKAFCEEAWGHLRQTKYLEALAAFNAALDLNAEDKNALVARSQCHLLIGEPHKALEDAEAALAIDKTFTKAILQKAESLYHLGDFEYSLVYFHRGLRIRPEMREFKLGVQKAQEAIENVIGDNKIVFPTSPRVLKKMFKHVQEKKEAKLSKMNTELSRSNIFNRGKKKKNPAAIRRIEKHILGDLYNDKNYLENLLKNTEALSLKQDFANDDIAQHAEEGIAYLKTRQEFWRQQKSSMPQRKLIKPQTRPKTSK